ncbi:MAG: DNA polymerase III subunit alpha [Candidatus Cloacimonadota bacterium]|nr:MAG: DNA polymerase III subunit alpha [Candidatus Cloacimonadota bacterium]PIE78431.1 MAG: DNA polymerase III subunit alpha [Candidatus Delongbacteria bacterium]
MDFVHLHNHSHYSLLDGLSKPKKMVAKAKELGQKAIALTDHGNMMGAIDFFKAAKAEGIKPILGCEVYITQQDMEIKTKENRYFHLILLIKNKKGYENLIDLISQGNLKGFYRKPRIDHKILKEKSEGLIALSACLAGEISQAIIEKNIEKAESITQEYIDIFGKENFFIEIQHHPELKDDRVQGEPVQNYVNKYLIEIAKKFGLGVVATNDSHYVNIEDAVVQDALICINTGKSLDDRTNRLSMIDGDYSILSTEKMIENFKHIPEAIENSCKIADMIDFDIEFGRNLVPVYDCPNGMNEEEYLRFLAYKGLDERYGIERKSNGSFKLRDGIDESSLVKPVDVILERTEFEIDTIIKMKYPGYFLIVQDFINWSKDRGILVGPGRGSAAGALISYLLKITNIDPLKYDLLFERFLNPDRISMPDIDIDFQDDKRDEVIDYVRGKYGKDNVCQVVTYQTMGAKNSIRDIGRVMEIPLQIVNEIAGTIPSKPGTDLTKTMENEPSFVEMYEKNDQNKKLIDMAMNIEGTIRGTGTHACAVIIASDKVYKYTPVMFPPKDTTSVISQYEGPQLEDIGLLKMDFLGLRNLSIISNCLRSIKKNYNIDLDIESISLKDEKTLKLYSDGLTQGIFQFESNGMKMYLKQLKPDRFDDLVAMNALYRPGPMENIPSFIARKHGDEPITYEHPLMEKYLKNTYGHTVYQEQVMLLSRRLAGFTKGDSDSLRKAMGKKKKELMDKLKAKFISGCLSNKSFIDQFKPVEGAKTPKELSEKVWNGWEEFAKYAFNKSHSVCYAYVSYQTAYLKAHYPVEYMASMLESISDNSDKVIEYISECSNLGIDVIPPDVNHSDLIFLPTKEGKIAFGMKGIKNVGEKALEGIIEERKKGGKFKDIYDFMDRIDLGKANKRTLEFLTKCGALDSLGHGRAKIIESLDDLLSYYQKKATKKKEIENNLFGDAMEDTFIKPPKLKNVEEWGFLERLEMEKEFVGNYISGHPLDPYKDILNAFCFKGRIDKEIAAIGKPLKIGGKINKIQYITTKKGDRMAKINLLTLNDELSLVIFPKAFKQLEGKYRVEDIGVFTCKVQIRKEMESVDLFVDEYMSYEEASKLYEERTNRIRISVNPENFNQEKREVLLKYLIANRGEKEISFKVKLPEKEIYLKSETIRVNGSFKFIKGLKEIVGGKNVQISF